ncbi:hypothetical protein GJ688_09780 [Heliobacillus mobilis]|uniref:Uncharacterized protein n=1 Tax=Heliobacterium mobile TaxID=28064 RepID=A0A6I3SLB3_HELMO|nr:CBO0543 family protein [Heliobacterium mobile]MTV49267.1 hypothetical protein [Heliobacterium mobile]
MSIEIAIQIASIVLIGILLILFVPRDKVRHAHVIFFFKQLLTWFLGLLVAEYNLIEYPIRFFQNATKASFTFEFFVYPGICVLFNLFYPEKESFLKRAVHYSVYSTGITVFELILEVYTDAIIYIRWTWYWTWITIALTFLASRWYYRWYRGDFTKPPRVRYE